jgi:hypothetical protein
MVVATGNEDRYFRSRCINGRAHLAPQTFFASELQARQVQAALFGGG